MEEKKDKKKEMSVDEAVKVSIKQGESSTRDIIIKLQELIEHEATHLRLIATLRYSLKQVMDEMIAFRPDILPKISLEKIGLKKLYEVLEAIEKEEAKEIRKYEEKRSKEIH